jgi:hypothetical protein
VKKIMSNSDIYWDSIAQFFKSIEIVFRLELPITQRSTEKIEAIVDLSKVDRRLSEMYESLSAVLGVPLQNGGNVTYNEHRQLSFLSRPQVMLVDNGAGALSPHLVVGVTRKVEDHDDYHSTIIPLELIDGDYYLAGEKLSLRYFPTPPNTQAKPKVMLELAKKRYATQLFPLRMEKDQDLNLVRAAFDDGKLETVLLGDTVSRWFKATNFLEPTFEADEFPKSGVMLVLTRCSLKSNPYMGNTITSVSATPIWSSHPDLTVRTNTDELVLAELGDVNNLSFNSGSALCQLMQDHVYTSQSIVYCHFLCAATNVEGDEVYTNTPTHIIGTYLQIFTESGLKLIQIFQETKQKAKAVIDDRKNAIGPAKMEPVAAPTVAPVAASVNRVTPIAAPTSVNPVVQAAAKPIDPPNVGTWEAAEPHPKSKKNNKTAKQEPLKSAEVINSDDVPF